MRDRRGLEEARQLTSVVFDKTGTLTRGEFGVVRIATAEGLGERRHYGWLRRSSGTRSTPSARASCRAPSSGSSTFLQRTAFGRCLVLGCSARTNGRTLVVGGPALIRSRSVRFPRSRAPATEAARQGQAVIYLVEETGAGPRALAIFVLADVIRPESREAMRRLHERG